MSMFVFAARGAFGSAESWLSSCANESTADMPVLFGLANGNGSHASQWEDEQSVRWNYFVGVLGQEILKMDGE